MISNKLVSAIVVNYNGKKFLKECIESLSNQTYQPIEIILVDNASTDGSTELINKLFPSVNIIKLNANKGFTGGNIEGLKHVKGEYIFLVNNDVVLDKECIYNLVLSMEKSPEIGIGAVKMLVYGTNIIDSAGDGFSTALKGFKRGEGLNSSNFDKEEFVFGACAGAAIYKREMINEIGFFDDDFFIIFEDVDLNFRAQLYGWKVLFIPSAIAHHRVRSTIGMLTDTAVFYSLRNCELVRIKNIPLSIFIQYFPFFVLAEFLDLLYFAIKNRKIKLYIKAKISVLKIMPSMLKKRDTIMERRRVSNKYLKNLMTPIFQKGFFLSKLKKFLSR